LFNLTIYDIKLILLTVVEVGSGGSVEDITLTSNAAVDVTSTSIGVVVLSIIILYDELPGRDDDITSPLLVVITSNVISSKGASVVAGDKVVCDGMLADTVVVTSSTSSISQNWPVNSAVHVQTP